MDRRDQQLLNKRFQPFPRRDGVMIIVLVGVFLAGLTAGSFIFTSQPPAQTTSSDGKTALGFPS